MEGFDLLQDRLYVFDLISFKLRLLISAFTFSRRQNVFGALGNRKELIFLQLLHRYPLLGVDSEDPPEQLSQNLENLFGNRRVVFDLHLLDIEALGAFRIDLILHVDAFEWKVSEQHLEHQHTHSPHIHLVIVYLLLEDLGSHVGSSPAESVHIFIVLPAKTHIAYLDHISIRTALVSN